MIYAVIGSKKRRRKSNFTLIILQSSIFLTRKLKKLYEFTVIPGFTPQLAPKKGKTNQKTTQIEVRGNKKFDNVNQNNFN